MKKFLAVFMVFCLCLGFAGCDAEAKLMAKVEEKIYSYEFSSADVENLEKLAKSKVFQKWIAKMAPKILEGAFSETEVSALVENLGRAKIYSEEIRDAYLQFVGKGSFEEQMKNGNVIEVLKQLKDKSYLGSSKGAAGCLRSESRIL